MPLYGLSCRVKSKAAYCQWRVELHSYLELSTQLPRVRTVSLWQHAEVSMLGYKKNALLGVTMSGSASASDSPTSHDKYIDAHRHACVSKSET